MIVQKKNSHFIIVFITAMILLAGSFKARSQAESAKEEDYFKIMRMPAPEGTILEVGGLCTLPNGDLAVTTRRGDVYIVENPTGQRPYFRKFATGLHEVLGVAYKNGALYCAQRGELTKLLDTDKDGKADVYETVYAWPISGNYHEYSFGPKLAPDGSFFVTLNLGFPQEWWHPRSFVPWRGWALKIFEDGQVEPWATGLRSPCGISMIDGELFYTDNQGDWVGSGSIKQIKKGGFMGHPAGLTWSDLPNSPVKVNANQVYAKVDPRLDKDNNGNPVMPDNIIKEKGIMEYQMKEFIPSFQPPVVWLPHGILGISNSEIVKIPEGVFGPFAGQLLVGDQGQSMIDRVFLEKVNGEYQGAAWAFRSGFQSGIVRLAWAKDGVLIAGETNRGWGSAGEATEGLQRLVWNKKVPFEMRAVRAMPDGFEIEFTKPVDKNTAEDLASYSVESFIYKYHAVYGSPMVNKKPCVLKGVKVSADGMKARLIVHNLRRYYIHTISLFGIKEKATSFSLVHPTAYYTLNNIPAGDKLALNKVSTKNSAAKFQNAKNAAPKNGVIAGKSAGTADDKMVKNILKINTCLACHHATKKLVGPSYTAIAKRNYTSQEIMSLIRSPKPEHWPEYATPMPPMPQVSAAHARTIAAYIISLKK